MNQVPRWQPEENLYLPVSKSEKWMKSRMLLPEQNSISIMKDIVTKISKVKELVMDIFPETFTTGKACLMLP